MSKALDSIRVAIRVRPLLKRESGSKPNWQVEENTIIQLNDGKRVPNAAFTFDRIFDKDMATVDVYMDFAKPIVISAMEGINGTLFAYGQTSSGKTYTMTGDEKSPGIILYTLDEVFDYISKTVNREFLMRVSYMEIYNEVITDLLKPKHTNLKIHENAKKQVFVGDLTEEVVNNVEAIIDLMKIGERNRHFGCTNMNERSSRSHTIFRMVIESRETSRNSMGGGEVDGAVKVSHLNLVDLAGSERASVTGAEGIRLREGGFINKSLFALGNVINKLSEDESAFVPFRDSKLTRILQTSLGGNAKTSIICAITPASMDETLSTLQFASRAKTIKNRPEVNEVCDESTLLKRYKRQINELKKQIEQFTNQEPMIELQTEKEKVELLLHEQRELAAKQSKKMLELANFFCTARPKDTEKQAKRNKRRWTVCPMDALSKPPMHLDLPNSFGQGFMMPNKRLKATDGSTSSSSLDSLNSNDFNTNNLNRFFAEIDEREEEIDEEFSSEGIIPIGRLTGERDALRDERDAIRNDLSENITSNVADERIAELELELKRLTGERDAFRDERDAIRNDLSENITSSCEVQEDLVKTKQTLKEKKQQNRELQERINQLEALRGSFADKQDEEKQILELRNSLSKEREMLAITEATFSDMCLAKEEVEKELAKYKEDNQTLVTDLKAAEVAKEEAMTECHRLRELQKELEEKEELFDVIKGDLDSVDALQEELHQEQEKNGALHEEIRKSKDDNQKLREELEIQVKLFAGSQPECSFPDQETTLTKTNEMFEESVKKVQLLEEEKVRQKVYEQQVAVIKGLEQRVQQLEVENTLALEFKTSVTESSSSYEDIVKEQANEISELKQKVKQLTRKRRRADIHSSTDQFNVVSLESNPAVDSVISLVEELEKKISLQDEYWELRDVVSQVKKNLTRMEGDGCEDEDKVSEDGGLLVVEKKQCVDIEELEARNSQLVQELEDVKREQQQSRSVNECNGDDNDTLDTDKLETELQQAISRGAVLVEEHEATLALRQKEFDMELERRNLELIEKDKLVDTLIKELKETKLAKEASDSCNRSGGLKIGGEQKPECCVLETCKTIEEVREKLRQAMACDPAFSEEHQGNIIILLKKFSEELERKETELGETNVAICELKQQLEQATYESELKNSENGNWSVDFKKELDNELGGKDAELEEMSNEVLKLKEELEQAVFAKNALLTDNNNLEKEFKAQLEKKERELEANVLAVEKQNELLEQTNSDCGINIDIKKQSEERDGVGTGYLEVAELRMQLEQALAAKESFADEREKCIDHLRRKFQEDMEQKDIELQEQSSEIDYLKKRLEEQRMSVMVPLQENTVVEALEEELANKEIELEGKSSEIDRLEKQLEDSSLSIETPLQENTVVEEKLATKEIELREKCSEIEELKKHLEELSMSIRVPLRENTVVEALEEELANKEIELEEKYSEIDQLKKQLEDRSLSIETPLQENKVLEEKLATKEIELREKCSEIEELKKHLEDLSMSIRVPLREDTVIEGLEKELEELQEQLREAISSKELLQQEHEGFIASLNTKFQEEMTKNNTELEKEMSVVGELQEQLQQEISEKEALSGDFKQDIARLQKTFDIELEEKNSEIEEKDILRKTTDEQLHEAIRSKEALVIEHDNFISRLKNELAEELQVLRTAVEDKSNSVDQLQESLQDTSASRDSLKRNFDELASHKKELELELQTKSDAFEEKHALVVSLEEQINDFAMAKEELIREHEVLGKEIDEEKKRIEDLLEEKSSLCAKVEDERVRAVLENEVLVQDREEIVARLKKEYCEEVERLSSVIEEKSNRVRELEEEIADKDKKYEERILENEEFQRNTEALVLESKEITAELDQKRVRISQVESALAKELKTREALTEERNSVLSKCQRLEEEISGVRLDLITKSDELFALGRKASDTDTTMQALNQGKDSLQEDLQKKNETLREECGRLEAQVKELLEQNTADADSKDELISELRKHVDQLTKESDPAAASTESGEDCRDSKEKRRKRESLLFKSMLEDIKEQCSADAGDTNQNKLIDELNYTLVATQEKLEQKEFVIDEKEIEIMERDKLVADLEGKLDKVGVSHEGKFAALQSDVEQKSQEIEDWKIRFERAEGALEKARKESEGIVSQLRNEKNELQSKIEEHESILSEEQLKEFYYSMEEKDKRINDLEQELSDASKTEQKVLELEMEMEILQNEVSSWKNSSEEAQGSLKDLKEIIKEQENHIIELQSSKASTKLKQDEKRDCELRDLHVELEAARSRLEGFAEEKNKLEQRLKDFSKKEQKILELEMELEVLQNEVSSWKYNSEEAQGYLRDSEEMIKKQEGRILELESSKASVNENQETESELKQVRVELETARSRLESFENEKNRGLEILEEKNRLLGDYEDEIDALNEDLDKKGEELKEATERLENALQERKEMETRVGKAVEEVKAKKEEIKDKETQVNKAVEEINATKAELKEVQEAYRTGFFSSERERALKQLSDQDQSSVIEKLRKDLKLAEDTYDDVMDERFRMEKIINEQEAECEEYKQKIEELEEAEKSRGNLRDEKLQAEAKAEREKEWKEKEQQMKKMKEDNEFLKEYVEQRDEDYARVNGFIQEMEDEIDGYKEQVDTLESEKRNLEKLLADKENTSFQQQQQSKEASELKSQINSLETEVKRLRDLARVDLEDELKKVQNELKTKNLDLYHVSYEKEKQLDSAKSQIRHLEKDCSSYARKNNELKIELRRLRNQDDDPTIEIVNRQQSSSRNGDSVGVIGSVALFTLDAKVAQLQEENGKSKHQIETLQQQNDALNITNLDLKQRYREVFDKYNRLKEIVAKNTEAAKLRDPKLDEKPDSGMDSKVLEPKAKDQRPADPMQASKQQRSRLTQPKVASALSKAGTEVETSKRKPTVLRQNKENVPREKPDACNTQ